MRLNLGEGRSRPELIVDALLGGGQPDQEEANFRVLCSGCEQEFGEVPDNVAKSHSYCKRHFERMYHEMGSEPPQGYPSSSFAPDLAPLSPEQRRDYRVATRDKGMGMRTKVQRSAGRSDFFNQAA